MELPGMEDFVVGFGVAFITSLILIGAVAASALAGIAGEEKAGHRLLWAEWPTDEWVEVAPVVKLRKAAWSPPQPPQPTAGWEYREHRDLQPASCSPFSSVPFALPPG